MRAPSAGLPYGGEEREISFRDKCPISATRPAKCDLIIIRHTLRFCERALLSSPIEMIFEHCLRREGGEKKRGGRVHDRV